jgi:tetratricopeptide (TPR) repeat protein
MDNSLSMTQGTSTDHYLYLPLQLTRTPAISVIKTASTSGQAPFLTALRRALEHVADPAWLAANSPLATPYFLGAHFPVTTGPDDPAAGRALQTLLYETADSFWGSQPPPSRAALIAAVEEARQTQGNTGGEYAYYVLELRYFRRYIEPNEYPATSSDIPVYLAVSNTRFYVHLDEAIDWLGDALLHRIQPALRPEQPRLPETFVGRERELRELAAALDAGHSVSLTGPPGAGKTTLGAVLAHNRPDGRAFWLTFLPGLNDTLGSALFALAHFTREQGAAALWAYLAAHRGEAPDPARATGLLRADLAALGDPAPLLVLDEVDLLRSADGEARSAAHSQLLFFLESLVTAVPLLLIGQRTYVDTPVHLSLAALDDDGVATLLAAAGTPLSRAQAQRVREVTGGLPRLVWLVVSLLRSGEDLEEMTRLPLRGDATPLFHRLWRRLGLDERELLVALSTFRRPAPADVWTRHKAAYDSLSERRLLESGGAGEIALQPFFRRLVYQELRPEQREQFHLYAGQVRAERGDYTAAAYHFAQAGEPEPAVAVWFPQRELEISRGQAGAAYDIFAPMSGKGLSPQTTRRLKVIQNQLYLLAGETSPVTVNVRSITWDMDDALTAEAYSQAAVAAGATGNYDGALDYYNRAIEVLGRLVGGIVDNHYRRGNIYADLGELSRARDEARRAEHRLLLFKGRIEYFANAFDSAVEILQQALAIAVTLSDEQLMALTNGRLAEVYSSLGRVPEAEHCLQDAITHHERIGDRLIAEYLRVTLGSVYINARMYPEAIPPSERALAFLEHTGQTEWTIQPLVQLAEAYLETGRTEEAVQYAFRVLNQEVPLYRPYALYTLGLARQRQGQEGAAAQAFAEGIAVARRNEDRFIEAYLQRNAGRLLAAQGDKAAARAALSAAQALFTTMNIAHEVAATEDDLAALA